MITSLAPTERNHSSAPNRSQHLGIGGGQILAKAPKGLVPGNGLHYVKGHPPAYSGLGQGPAEAMGAHPLQTQASAGQAQGLVGGLTGLGGGGAAHRREQDFAGGGGVAMLSLPGVPVGGQHLTQGRGDRNLTGFAGFGGGGPVRQAAIHISPAQGQGFADPGGGPSLHSPQGPVAGRRGGGQQLIKLLLSQSAGFAVAIDF